MQSRQIELSREQLEGIARIDASIDHWSKEHTRAALRAQDALSQAHALYGARQQALDGALREAGLDPALVIRGQLDPVEGGTAAFTVLMREAPEPAAPDAKA